MMMTYTNLQTKITIMLVVILTVSIGLNNAIGTYLFQKQYATALEERIMVIGQGLKAQIETFHVSAVADNLIGFDEAAKDTLRKYKELSSVYALDASGRVLFSSIHQELGGVPDVPELLEAVTSRKEGIVSYDLEGSAYVSAVVPYPEHTGGRHAGSVVVIADRDQIHHQLYSLYTYPTLLTLLFSLLSFVLIMLTLSKWVTSPLKRMVLHMDEAAAGNLHSYANTTAQDEIGQLGGAFNRMLKQTSELLMQTTQAIELESRYNAEHRQRMAGESLRHAISAVSSTLDEQEVNERILASLRELLPYTSATLWIQHYDTLTAMMTRYDESSAGYLTIEFTEQQARGPFALLQRQEQPLTNEENQVYLLYLPILIENKVRGMIIVQNGSPFVQGEVGLAFTYSSQVGSYIQNAQLYRQMQRLAATDVLTGIYNRRYFFEQAVCIFKQSIESNSDLGVIMFDVDHFKSVNDQYGHPVGDLVLASVAGRVSSYLPANESQLFGRYGGEEFVILINGASGDRIYALAERIRSGIQELSFPTSRGNLCVTASLGIAYRSAQADTLEKLLKAADNALYAAKANGRNCVALADEE